MQMLLRSMSPEVIAVDELGREADYAAVESAVRAGVKILGTVHAQTKEELYQKPHMEQILASGDWRLVRLMRTADCAGRQAVLYFPGQEEGIWVS